MPMAFALLGLGLPFAAAGALLFRLAFLPGKSGHALYAFSSDHPLVRVAGVLLLVGAAFAIPGFLLFLAGPRPSPRPPEPANFRD